MKLFEMRQHGAEGLQGSSGKGEYREFAATVNLQMYFFVDVQLPYDKEMNYVLK
jgi:hypothetical protein